MKKHLILLLSILFSVAISAQEKDTLRVDCPSFSEFFTIGPYIEYTVSPNHPDLMDLSDKEMKKIIKREKKEDPYLPPDSLYQPNVCQITLDKKHRDHYYVKVYDSYGRLRHEGDYLGHLPSGKYIKYYRNGKKQVEGQYLIRKIDERNKSIAIGTWTTYRISGLVDKKEEK